jgi:Ca-activated chloride channel family protein
LIETPLLRSAVLTSSDQATDAFRFAAAVAAFGQRLRGGVYLEDFSFDEIAALANGARGTDPFGYRGEFLQLVALAESLAPTARVAQD